MKYEIYAQYETGDSFSSSHEGCNVSDHNDLDIAKQNLQRIKAHYLFYQSFEDARNRKQQDAATELVKNEVWFVNEPKLYNIAKDDAVSLKAIPVGKEHLYEYRPDSHIATYYLLLLADNGNSYRYQAQWCGYFESLESVEIKLNQDDNDMRIDF